MPTDTLFLVTLIATLFFAPGHTTAQRQSLPKWEIRGAVGLLPTFVKDHVETLQPPLSVELRYRPARNFSIGILTGQSTSRGRIEHHNGESRLVTNRFHTTAVRLATHSNPWERWEVYGGLVLAYNRNDVSYTETEVAKNLDNFMPIAPVRDGFVYTAFLGTSVQAVPRLQVFGELGFGLSILTTGVSYRL